jgi:hypothetical protein
MHRLIAAVSLALAPVIAGATIYKVQMPDGTILFTDAPPANGKILEERASPSTVRPPAKAATPAPGATSGPPSQPIPVLPSRTSPPPATPMTLDQVNAEITTAERELTVARRKLEVGREPLPGERLGTAKGGSRLSPEYESRITELEREVAAAEQRVKRAYDARNALR